MITDAAREKAMHALIDGAVLRLYGNDATPSEGSALAGFAELPVAGGYTPFPVPPGAWSVEWAVNETGVRRLRAAVSHSWDFRGVRVSVYGWVLELGGVVVTGKRFGAKPLAVTPVGGRIEATVWVEV